jgi:homotetrameric cytidine deaminase
MALDDHDLARLVDAARLARSRAYAPYSNFTVGCALQLADGTVVTGANIENSSYGLVLCAERAAMASLYADRPPGERSIVAVVIAGPDDVADCSPCGGCRQWIHELAPDAVVAFPWKGEVVTVGVDQLLPYGFDLG